MKTLLAPRALIAGVFVSFSLCCLLGRIASQRNQYRNFERFHPHLNHLSLYYPTASQTRAIAQEWMDQDRIIVVVGGCSVLYGTGQTAEQLWSKRLEAALGAEYRVLNFALPGTYPFEVGAVAAEIIARDYQKVIFIMPIWASAAHSPGPPVGPTQPYFYWDAYYKGLLTLYEPRATRIAELTDQEKDPSKYAELKTRTMLDSAVYCQDLWTTFSYCYASTVWCPYVRGTFMRPRGRYADTSPELPVNQRYTPEREEWWSDFTRTHVQGRRWAPALNKAIPPNYAESPLAQSLVAALPPHLRQRTIVAIMRVNPHYLNKVSEDQKADYEASVPETYQAIEAAGCHGMEIGRDYGDIDYLDAIHISGEGAVKMARDAEPHVRMMAEQLGYTK